MVPLVDIRPEGPGRRLTVDLKEWAQGVVLGDSIALNGCCLTAIAIDRTLISFEAGEETLSRTKLGLVDVGTLVNVERSLRVGDRLGGHWVTGHIDGLGRLVDRRDDGPWSFLYFGAAAGLMRQMASKGSIAVDGVSLTLVAVDDRQFSVALIPHTLQATTLGKLAIGDVVNLETDILAKYVQRQLESEQAFASIHHESSRFDGSKGIGRND